MTQAQLPDDYRRQFQALERRIKLLEQERDDVEFDVDIPAGAGWTSHATYSRIGREILLQGFFSKTSGTPASGNVMGTLPFPPSIQMNPAVVTQNGDVNGSILIQTNGQLVWRTGSTTETDSTAIDGISYVMAE